MSSLLLSHSYSEDQLRQLRTELFDSAKSAGLVHPKDNLVRRLKRAVGPSLVTKYANDIADLCYALKHKQLVPRILLKNGKRSTTSFIASRLQKSPTVDVDAPTSYLTESHSTSSVPISPALVRPEESSTTSQSCDVWISEHNNNQPNVGHSLGNNKAITALERELSSLRRDVTQLKSELLDLRRGHSVKSTETCSLYVKLKAPACRDLNKTVLSDMLQCPVLHYSVIRRSPTTSLRVRILKTHLHTALTTSNNQLALVRAWRATVPFSNCLPTPSDQSQHRNLMITTWNCRGLTTGEPYIHQLAGEGSDIIAITEHWLWPF